MLLQIHSLRLDPDMAKKTKDPDQYSADRVNVLTSQTKYQY